MCEGVPGSALMSLPAHPSALPVAVPSGVTATGCTCAPWARARFPTAGVTPPSQRCAGNAIPKWVWCRRCGWVRVGGRGVRGTPWSGEPRRARAAGGSGWALRARAGRSTGVPAGRGPSIGEGGRSAGPPGIPEVRIGGFRVAGVCRRIAGVAGRLRAWGGGNVLRPAPATRYAPTGCAAGTTPGGGQGPPCGRRGPATRSPPVTFLAAPELGLFGC